MTGPEAGERFLLWGVLACQLGLAGPSLLRRRRRSFRRGGSGQRAAWNPSTLLGGVILGMGAIWSKYRVRARGAGRAFPPRMHPFPMSRRPKPLTRTASPSDALPPRQGSPQATPGGEPALLTWHPRNTTWAETRTFSPPLQAVATLEWTGGTPPRHIPLSRQGSWEKQLCFSCGPRPTTKGRFKGKNTHVHPQGPRESRSRRVQYP